MDAYEIDACFPVEWNTYAHDGFGGPAVELADAGVIYISESDELDSQVVGKTTLTEMVGYFIDGTRHIESGYICEEFVPAAEALSAALRAAADMLDAAKPLNAAQSHPA